MSVQAGEIQSHPATSKVPAAKLTAFSNVIKYSGIGRVSMKARAQLALALLATALVVSQAKHKPTPKAGPKPLYSGYVPLDSKPGSSLYYAYWEATNSSSSAEPPTTDRPILLWLQGGPGCASSFGAFYELGPYIENGSGELVQNPFAWNQNFGLLIIDQPIGTGYSIAGSEHDIPVDLEGVSEDLYTAIWQFFYKYRELQQRPFFITGESYAGKYIPSITHYILQVEDSYAQAQQQGRPSCRLSRAKRAQHLDSEQQSPQGAALHSESTRAAATGKSKFHNAWQQLLTWWRPGFRSKQQQQQQEQHARKQLRHTQQPQQQLSGSLCWQPRHARTLNLTSVPLPNFNLVGVAIGNGLTDPQPQTRALASVVFNMGLVSDAVQAGISQRTEDVVQQISQGLWEQATDRRSALLEFIQEEAGVATLLDVRRTEGYDAAKAVDALLDSAAVRASMGAALEAPTYSSCSQAVARVMAADVMRSCLVLVEDILDVLPVLLYQGQFDVQDGVAGTNAWLRRLDWGYITDFEDQEGQLWYAEPGIPAGWVRQASTLTQVMVRNAGHMVPRDQPAAAQAMIQQWVADVLGGQGWDQGHRSAGVRQEHGDVSGAPPESAQNAREEPGVAVSR